MDAKAEGAPNGGIDLLIASFMAQKVFAEHAIAALQLAKRCEELQEENELLRKHFVDRLEHTL